ncbi:hypothetical protein V9T40_002772 [Parthenolecanium corni]|uniref:Uncharacterized protein n=1 Tax=Parthenolecanium corni TaxID=536013 RepID=A0AAN9TJ13_9HEMI
MEPLASKINLVPTERIGAIKNLFGDIRTKWVPAKINSAPTDPGRYGGTSYDDLFGLSPFLRYGKEEQNEPLGEKELLRDRHQYKYLTALMPLVGADSILSWHHIGSVGAKLILGGNNNLTGRKCRV